MPTYCLEMRSTQHWDDVRYRSYTTSEKRAERFRTVPVIPFTDSGHRIVPSVREHSGRRLPNIWLLDDHVRPHLNAPVERRESYADVVRERDRLRAEMAASRAHSHS